MFRNESCRAKWTTNFISSIQFFCQIYGFDIAEEEDANVQALLSQKHFYELTFSITKGGL